MAERLKYLSGNMYDGDISEFSGKQFTLLNFDSASEKIFAKRIKEREGVKKGTVTKKTDYVVVCLSRWEQMSEEIDHAIRIHSEGNPVRLISEYTMWRAIEQTGIAEE